MAFIKCILEKGVQMMENTKKLEICGWVSLDWESNQKGWLVPGDDHGGASSTLPMGGSDFRGDGIVLEQSISIKEIALIHLPFPSSNSFNILSTSTGTYPNECPDAGFTRLAPKFAIANFI